MENKKGNVSTVFLVIAIILILVMGAFMYMQKTEADRQIAELKNNASKMQETINNLQGRIDNVSGTINNDNSNSNEQTGENIILYNGSEILKKVGIQFFDLDEMEINKDSEKKYNTTYYNYENGTYLGTTTGTFGEETYEGYSIVKNVKRIAMTQKYNAIPRQYKKINKLPEQIIDMANYSSVDIHEIDLNGDGKNEHIVCYTINYAKGEIGDGEPRASSGIILYDANYKKIADLVSLENGFWSNIKEESYKIFLSLDKVEYIDIDNDGIMEIIIDVPVYEGTEISIIKYNNNKIEGEINLQATVLP